MKTAIFLGSLVAFVITAAVGVGLILGAVDILSFSSLSRFVDELAGTIVFLIVGAALLGVAAHFILLAIRNRQEAALFTQQGEWGRIELSPYAVEEFISGILQTEIGLDRFRVALRHRDEGIAVTVRTAVTPDQRVSDVSARIQRVLAQQVTERTGITVHEVSVHVRSIRRREDSSDDALPDDDGIDA